MTALTKTFNSEKPKDVENRPNGTPAKMLEWYWDAWNPTLNRDQLDIAMIARNKHKLWLDNLTHIDLDMVEQLYMTIKTPVEGEITLHQVLISIWSKTNYKCNIFQAVNQNAVTGFITTLCHSGYEEETNKVMMNLVILCKERFGKKKNLVYPGGFRRIKGSGL